VRAVPDSTKLDELLEHPRASAEMIECQPGEVPGSLERFVLDHVPR
jgi:hypothetical protein